MCVFARFERSRKGMGEEDSYKAATSGSMQVMKKKNMLAGWVLDSGKFGKHYKEWQQEYDVTKKHGVYGMWLSQKEATDKFGEEQLKAMVQAGTIETRRLVTDPRFFEFRAVQQRDSTEVTGKKGIHVKGGQRQISNREVAEYSVMDVQGMLSTDFDFDQSGSGLNSSGSGADDLAKALKIQAKPKLPIKNKAGCNKEDKKWETLSKIEAGDSKNDIKKKIMEFKNAMAKEESAINTMALELSDAKHKKGLVIANKLVGELQSAVTSLNVLLKNTNAKKEDQKKHLMNAFALVGKAKAAKKELKVMLPKKEVKVAGKAKASEDEEEDDEEEAEDVE